MLSIVQYFMIDLKHFKDEVWFTLEVKVQRSMVALSASFPRPCLLTASLRSDAKQRTCQWTVSFSVRFAFVLARERSASSWTGSYLRKFRTFSK